MIFRLVPKSVTLNDPEWPNRPNGCLISRNSVPFWAHCVKVVEDTRIICGGNVGQRMWFLTIYHLWRYWQGISPSDSVEVRHSSLASENLTKN